MVYSEPHELNVQNQVAQCRAFRSGAEVRMQWMPFLLSLHRMGLNCPPLCPETSLSCSAVPLPSHRLCCMYRCCTITWCCTRCTHLDGWMGAAPAPLQACWQRPHYQLYWSAHRYEVLYSTFVTMRVTTSLVGASIELG